AAPPPKPAPPAPKPVVKPEPWLSPLVDELEKRFPGTFSDALIFRNQPSMTVAKESLIAVSEDLKSQEGGAYVFLTYDTAVDYPKRPKRDRKSTRLNSSHLGISYAVFCLKK